MNNKEIERKFLVTKVPDSSDYSIITQGYICVGDKEEVRIRSEVKSDTTTLFSLTTKRGTGLVRGEWEISIDISRYVTLLPAAEGRIIVKKRLKINATPPMYVDVFRRNLEGLVLAEIEFEDEEKAKSFLVPEWLGKEVTDDSRYKNSSLAIKGVPEE